MRKILVIFFSVAAIALVFQNCARVGFKTDRASTTTDVHGSGVIEPNTTICIGTPPDASVPKLCTDGSSGAIQKVKVTCVAGAWKVENDGDIDYAGCAGGCIQSEKPNYSSEQKACFSPYQTQVLAIQKYKATCNSEGKWIKSTDGTIDYSSCPRDCDNADKPSSDRSCSATNTDLVGTILNYYSVSCNSQGQWINPVNSAGGNYQCSCADTSKVFNQSTKTCSNIVVQQPKTFGLTLTSEYSGTMGANSFTISNPKLQYRASGFNNSFNITLKNTGNTACTLTGSEAISQYGPGNANGLSALFSIDASSLATTIQKDATAVVAINAVITSSLNYEFNASNNGILGSLKFRCGEDTSNTVRLAIGLTHALNPILNGCAGTCQALRTRQDIFVSTATTVVVPSGADQTIYANNHDINVLVEKGARIEFMDQPSSNKRVYFEGNANEYFFNQTGNILRIKDACGNISRVNNDQSNKYKFIFKNGTQEFILTSTGLIKFIDNGTPRTTITFASSDDWASLGYNYLGTTETSQSFFSCGQ